MRHKERWTLVILICASELIGIVVAVNWLSDRLQTALLDPTQATDLSLVQMMRYLSFAAAAVLVATTGVLTHIIARRYEARLESVNRSLEQLLTQRSIALTRTRDAVIFGLAKLAESRDHGTGEHLDRVFQYTRILASELVHQGLLDPDRAKVIAEASTLHDIGKVGIGDAVLLKRGPLDPPERREMHRHTIIGGQCLEAIQKRLGSDDFLATACDIAYHHHERWDGKGYPFGLRGEAISLAGRIVALADVYDALTSERSYKQRMPHDKARQIILDLSGSQFDPTIVEAFLKWEDAFAEVAASNTDTSPSAVTDRQSTVAA